MSTIDRARQDRAHHNSTPRNRIPQADVTFQALSTTEWRVCDRRYPRHSIDALLGFVSRSGDRFLATRICAPGECVAFASLEEVAAFVSGGVTRS